jgi:hypothetical protein
LAWGLVLLAPLRPLFAQSPLLTSFQPSGTVTWTNHPGTNAFVVQWAPSASGPWSTNWHALDSIITTARQTLVSVPVFYRLAQAFTPATLRGPWIIQYAEEGNIFFIAAEDGAISESGIFVTRAPSGYFTVTPQGLVTIKLITPEEVVVVVCNFATPNRLAVHPPYEAAVIQRVEDPSLCAGRWSGNLTQPTMAGPPLVTNIVLDVNHSGLVTNMTGIAGNNIGRMFSLPDGAVGGFLYTGTDPDTTSPYRQIRISATLAGNTISGAYKTESSSVTGTVYLTRP